MKIYFSLGLLLCFASCNGQGKGTLPKNGEAKPSTEQPAATNPDVDPYWVEPQGIVSPNGPQSITRNMLQDRAGNMWFASWEGIIRYDGKSFSNFTMLEGLSKYHTFSVMEAKNGDLWFGTIGAGVYHYDGKSFTNFTKKDGLSDDKISCIVEDNSGKIWIGTLDGLTCYDPAATGSKAFTVYSTNEGLGDNYINAVMQDHTGRIWIGRRLGVSCYAPSAPEWNSEKPFTTFYDQSGLPFHNVRSIVEGKTGDIWIGGQEGLCRYNPGTVGSKAYSIVSTNFTGYVYEDRAGNIWASAADNKMPNMNLYRYDGKSFALRKPYGAPIILDNSAGGQVFGIVEDTAGNIWFGREGGVYRYNPAAAGEGSNSIVKY